MKKFIIIVLVFVAIAGGVAVYLVVTTPNAPRGVQFPLTGSQRALVASVPATADAFALIPTVVAVQSKLLANPATHDVVAEWMDKQDFPPSWILGGADVLAFRSGKQTSYLLRLDPLRAVLARTALMISGDTSARVMINAPAESPIAESDLAPLLELMNGLPAGDALAVQREGSRGSFPPIARPAVTSVAISPDNIDIVSHSGVTASPPARAGEAPPPHRVTYPRSAILTAWFAEPPRSVDDMNRLVGARASALLRDGGTIALYDVDTDKLLPHPREVIVLPDTPDRRAAIEELIPQQVSEFAGIHVETAEKDGQLLVAFDRKTLDSYLKDAFDAPALSANRWSVRIDPQRAAPILDQVADSAGLRLVAPHLFRSARDLSGWIANLSKAHSIEAAASDTGTAVELRVRIATK